jgi:hypothetical protein
LLKTFLTLGFRPLANPVLRATIAHGVPIGQACRQLEVNAEVVAALNRSVGESNPAQMGKRVELATVEAPPRARAVITAGRVPIQDRPGVVLC